MPIFKVTFGIFANTAIFGVLLLLPAGTLDWWRAWVFLGVVFVGSVASTVGVYRVNKGLLEERFKPPVQKGQPLADKILEEQFLKRELQGYDAYTERVRYRMIPFLW